MADPVDPNSIMVDIEGIHQFPVSTRNFTRYHESALKGSIPTWTSPYLRPMILHHNEKDGKIVGRIRAAEYTAKSSSNTPALTFAVNVADKEAKEGVMDGRYKTVSIGVIVSDCRCSICGHNIAEDGECEHERGAVYDGETCYWDIYSMEAKELSYVIVPSDIYAQNVKIYKPTETKNLREDSSQKGAMSMQEGTVLGEEVKPGAETLPVVPVAEGETVPAEPTPAEPANPAEPEAPAAEDNVEALKTKIVGLEAELETEKTATADALVKLAQAGETIAQAQKDLQNAKDAVVLKDADLIKEKQFRESVETELVAAKKQIREALEENFMSLRESLGKGLATKEDVASRSDESLKDAVKDLKEELSGKVTVPVIEPVTNPGIVEESGEVKPGSKKVELKEDLNDTITKKFEDLLSTLMNK